MTNVVLLDFVGIVGMCGTVRYFLCTSIGTSGGPLENLCLLLYLTRSAGYRYVQIAFLPSLFERVCAHLVLKKHPLLDNCVPAMQGM